MMQMFIMLQVAKGTELVNEIFLIVAATIYYHEDNYEAALKYVNNIQLLMKYNRFQTDPESLTSPHLHQWATETAGLLLTYLLFRKHIVCPRDLK